MRAAEQLLASSADGQISTREICSGAQVTAPTLYHHFKDKHALLDAVVLEGFNTYLDGKRAIAWSGDVLEDFRTGWDVHVSFGCEHPAHYRLMFGNPQADQTAPAALVARDELARTVAEWGAKGQLMVSVDAATETMSAAAVGVTLQLIAAQADSTHPISTNVRDTIAHALFHPLNPGDTFADGVTRPARQLLDALPRGPLERLRPTEVALLREWLASLADSSI
ncbi:transcriptional regulator, TetR family [Actinoalloteichus sp. GBA129-24]|uniref:Transcriptional regulator, TetR family n=2 Tax=Pseudonocardiaceae TaxID=2070 RepID=A0AAC9PSU6_9PSEU|nr:transcriptional regulator, TetR family [Actinoalloteichus fjordicus]APU21462.1 transcriptional regulator, TetR family [Actinoalloteichus sp. GBA129-24]